MSSCNRVVKRTCAVGLTLLGGILGVVGNASAQVVADSVADYSGVQGQRGWFYGYYDGDVVTPYRPSDFAMLPFYDVGVSGAPEYWHHTEGAGGFFTLMRASRCHPNGVFTSGGRRQQDHWAVRRWVSPINGLVRVRASFVDLNTVCGNGIRAHIFLGSQEVYSQVVTSMVEQVYEMDLCISVGTIIDFAVDPLDSWDSCDNTGTVFTITGPITRSPESALTCLTGSASMSVQVRGTETFTYQWRKDKVPIHDGPHYSGTNSATLNVTNARVADTGMYDCIVSVCGGAFASEQAELGLCYADYNCDGVVNSQDMFDFLSDLMNSNGRVDYINRDGYINSQDYFDFIQVFFAGCE